MTIFDLMKAAESAGYTFGWDTEVWLCVGEESDNVPALHCTDIDMHDYEDGKDKYVFLISARTEFSQWKSSVDDLFKREVCCSWADLAGEDALLEKAYHSGDAPREFVNWFIEKYGLTRR